MNHHLLECDAVARPPAPVPEYTAAEPSEVVDARVHRFAHATLFASRSAPSIGPWEFALGVALIAGYGAYAVAQILRIFSRVI